MNAPNREPELVDAYITGLLDDPAAQAPGPLDGSTVDMTRLLVEAEQVNVADTELQAARARVWQRALQAANETQAPATGSADNRLVRLPFLRIASLKQRWAFAAVAAVLVFALAALLVSTPKPVNAAEILARAGKVASQSGSYGLQSYHGVLSARTYQSEQEYNDTYVEIWFQAPDKVRMENHILVLHNTPVPQMQGSDRPKTGPDGLSMTVVDDGANSWLLSTTTDEVQWYDPRTGPGGLGIAGAAFAATSLQSLQANAAQDYDVTLEGTEQVLGRPAYKLLLKPKPNTREARYLSQATLWVDQATYLALKGEDRLSNGQIGSYWEYKSLELNPQIDPARFVYTPSAGTEVSWRSAPTEAEQLRQWSSIAAQVQFTTLMPNYSDVPQGFLSTAPHVMGDTWHGSVEEVFETSNLQQAITIWQSKGPGPARPKVAEQVQVGPITGLYVGSPGAGGSTLEFDLDGTHVAINVHGEVSKEDLVKLASSMRPVPQVAPGAPAPRK